MQVKMQGTGNGLFAVNEQAALRKQAQEAQEGKGQKGKGTSVFCGSLNLPVDTLAQRKKQAQKQAMKLVKDVFARDLQLDETTENAEAGMERLKQENRMYLRKLGEIPGRQEKLAAGYGVEADSQEQAELELLRKGSAASEPWNEISLTQEEKEQLVQIQERGLTDYQRESLTLDREKELYETYIEKNKLMIEIAGDTIGSMKLERLKQAPMVKAAKQADVIMQSAQKGIVSELFDEGVDHIQEEQEEKAEEAEEKAEKQQEKEEKIEEQKEKKEEQEEIIEEIQEGTENKIRIAQKMKAEQQGEKDMAALTKSAKEISLSERLAKILDKLKLLEEDLKGVDIDISL